MSELGGAPVAVDSRSRKVGIPLGLSRLVWDTSMTIGN